MDYVILALLGFGGGYLCAYIVLERKRKAIDELGRQQNAHAQQLKQADHAQGERQQRFDAAVAQFQAAQQAFNAKVISYSDLQKENAVLRRDLRNIDVSMRKLQLDRDQQGQNQHALDERSKALASRYLHESVEWINRSLTENNFATCKKRLLDAVERCRGIGFEVPKEEETKLVEELKDGFAKAVRAALQREEQARIKAKLREEFARDKEIERMRKQQEHEEEAIKAAIQRALVEANGQHTAEVERLKAQLAEAEERNKRAISQAQLTKTGNVYVISNIGSFGEGVYKIGMTRRLDYKERIDELGSASVPFPFDVHMVISSDDAPTFEGLLHKKLTKHRMNRINPRKEFFKIDIDSIIQAVKEHNGEVKFLVDPVAEPSAAQYRDSLSMTDEDREYVESVYDSAMNEDEAATVDDS